MGLNMTNFLGANILLAFIEEVYALILSWKAEKLHSP